MTLADFLRRDLFQASQSACSCAPAHGPASAGKVVEFPGLRQQFFAGDRVRIRAFSEIGSSWLLHGLTGKVMSPHPVAKNWYQIRLDPNDIAPQTDWIVPGDRLVREGDGNDAPLPPSAA